MTYDIFDSFKKRLNESHDTRFEEVTACGVTSKVKRSSEEMFDNAFESVYGIKSATPKSSLREGVKSKNCRTSLTEDIDGIPDPKSLRLELDEEKYEEDEEYTWREAEVLDSLNDVVARIQVFYDKANDCPMTYNIDACFDSDELNNKFTRESMLANSFEFKSCEDTKSMCQVVLEIITSKIRKLIPSNESTDVSRSHKPLDLKEDFGSFPDWLKTYLEKNLAVKKALSRRGVDLAHATYISGQLPQNARDAAFKDPSRVAVFRMVDSINGTHEVVYIPGVTDPDVYPDPYNRWTRYSASAISKKKLLQMTKEYGYIDMNDSRNSNTALRTKRYNDKQGMVVRDREAGLSARKYNVEYGKDEHGYTDYDNIISFDVKWVTKKGYDKSGYQLDPDKYGRMLDNVGLDDYSIRLQMLYNKIEGARTRIIALMSKYSVLDSTSVRVSSSWERNIFGDISRVVTDFSRAIDSYKELENNVQEIVNSDELEDVDKGKRIHSVFTWNGKRVRDYITEINDALKSIESAETR